MPNSIHPTVITKEGSKSLSKEEKKILDALTVRLRTNLQETVKHLIQIGHDLKAAKDLVGHGQFEAWLAENFDLSDQTARRFMHVAEAFSTNTQGLEKLSLSCVYLLAAPSTPRNVREEVIQRLQAGETISLRDIQSLRDQNETIHNPPITKPLKRKETQFRTEIKKANKRISSWSEQIQKHWHSIDGELGNKSKTELELLHLELTNFVASLDNMLKADKSNTKKKK